MNKAPFLAVALALFAAGCGSSHETGLGHLGGHKTADVNGGPPKQQVYDTVCPAVDQALQYHDAAHRAPMLATVEKLQKHPDSTQESFWLGAAAVVIKAEGIPNHQYPPEDKTEVINGCKKSGHPLKNLA